MPVMDTDRDMLEQFEQQGYVVVKGLLDPTDDLRPVMAEYHDLLDRLATEWYVQGKLSSDYSELPFGKRLSQIVAETKGEVQKHLDVSLPQKDIQPDTPIHCGAAVFDLLTNEKLLDAVEQFIGPEIYSNPVQHVRIKPPERYLPTDGPIIGEIARTIWHQDQGTILEEADGTAIVTGWIAVTESTLENGCMVVVPGSHKRGLVLHCHDPQAASSRHAIPERLVGQDRIPLPMKPGDVLFLTSLTMHNSLPNLSDDIRWSFDLRYSPIGEPTGRPWFPGFVARSRSHPELKLNDAEAWAASWDKARARLAHMPSPTFQRWEQRS